MRQLSHDVRITYVDNTDDTVQNCYNHQFQVENPNTYSSHSLNLVGPQIDRLNDLNYIYLSAQHPIRVVINGTNELVIEHLSYINTQSTFDVFLENIDPGILENNIQVLYGRVESTVTP